MLSLLVRTLPILFAAILGGLIASWVERARAARGRARRAIRRSPVVTAPLVEATAMETASRYKLGGVVEARETGAV